MNLITLPLTALPLILRVAVIANILADFLTLTFLRVNLVTVFAGAGVTLLTVKKPVLVNDAYLLSPEYVILYGYD